MALETFLRRSTMTWAFYHLSDFLVSIKMKK